MKQYERVKIRRAAAGLMLTVLLLTGCGRGADASGYVNAVLALTFQGETQAAMEYMEEPSKQQLMLIYQDSIDRFVAGNITNEIQMSELKTSQFAELVSKIFMTMRYQVEEAKRTDKDTYEVPVEIQPSDVFVQYYDALTEDSLKIAEKVENGEYQGTEEEMNQQVLNDIVNHAYELLDTAYLATGYGERQTVILRVTVEKNNEYTINEDDMDNLIVKILRLDEIGG